MLVLAADHEAGDVLQEQQGDIALATQLDEVRALERRFGEQDAVVGDDADRMAVHMREAGNQGVAVTWLEFIQARTVDDARDHLAHVVGLAGVAGNHAVKFLRVEQRRLAGLQRNACIRLAPVQVGDDRTHPCQRLQVVVGHVVGNTGDARMHVGTAEFFGADHFAGGGLHQRRATEEDRALFLDDDGLITHCRDIGAAGRAAAHHAGDLWDALCR